MKRMICYAMTHLEHLLTSFFLSVQYDLTLRK